MIPILHPDPFIFQKTSWVRTSMVPGTCRSRLWGTAPDTELTLNGVTSDNKRDNPTAAKVCRNQPLGRCIHHSRFRSRSETR